MSSFVVINIINYSKPADHTRIAANWKIINVFFFLILSKNFHLYFTPLGALLLKISNPNANFYTLKMLAFYLCQLGLSTDLSVSFFFYV